MRERLAVPMLAAVVLVSAAAVSGCLQEGGGGGFPDVVVHDEPPADPGPLPGEPGGEEEAPLAEKLVNPPHSGATDTPDEPGPHGGERPRLEVDIVFSGEYGVTTTDAGGIHYQVGDWVSHEDKVYPSEYWGEFPLYFFGTEVGVTVTITNPGPRQKAWVRIRTEAYVLRTDGTNGTQLAAPQEFDVTIMRGESVTIDASFTDDPSYASGADSGLDRFIVSVLHPNGGDETDWGDAALIMQKEAIFCPPDCEPF